MTRVRWSSIKRCTRVHIPQATSTSTLCAHRAHQRSSDIYHPDWKAGMPTFFTFPVLFGPHRHLSHIQVWVVRVFKLGIRCTQLQLRRIVPIDYTIGLRAIQTPVLVPHSDSDTRKYADHWYCHCPPSPYGIVCGALPKGPNPKPHLLKRRSGEALRRYGQVSHQGRSAHH